MVMEAQRPGTDGSPTGEGQQAATLLALSGLRIAIPTPQGTIFPANGVTLSVDKGRALAVLGESGSGKSVTMQAVMGLTYRMGGRIVSGSIAFRGRELVGLPERDIRKLCGKEIGMVFQDPLSSLNPVFTVGNQIAEMYRFHRSESKQLALKHAVEMMGDVGIPHAKERAADYPHQFSGGMRQRVMIAIALALKPSLLVADEPTTALDVTVQSEIIELIRGLCAERDMTLVLITHDLPVAAALCDHVAVMYAGRVVESGHIREVFDSPAHPYTDGLLHAIPDVSSRGSDLKTISGRPPNLLKVPSGCPFHVRCPLADEICKTDQPLSHLASSGSEVEDHTTACHHADLILPSDEATRGEELT